MPKSSKKNQLIKIKLPSSLDQLSKLETDNNCQFFIVNDDEDSPNLIMVYRNFNTEAEIYDFIETMNNPYDYNRNRTFH